MAIDPMSPRSRRAMLAAGLAAAVATVASALGRPSPVSAASGAFDSFASDTAAVSAINHAESGYPAHGVRGYSASADGIATLGHASAVTGQTVGVYGESGSTGGTGVLGISQAATGSTVGVLGLVASPAGTGVLGYSGTWGLVPGASPRTGVYGYAAQDVAAVGVKGASTAGTGGLFTATTGTALQVAGKAKFSRCGRASVPKNKTYVDVTVAGGLAANSVVSATLQTYRSGVAIAAVRANYPVAGKARIYLTKVASTTASTSVGWLVTEY